MLFLEPRKFILPTGITFVDDSTECEATYYITDKTIKCPKTVNVEKHYEIKWVYTLTYDAANTLEITGTKGYKPYKTTFKLPEGYTFDGTNATKEVSYTLENYLDAEAPELPTVEHYTLAWEKEFTLTEENLGTVTEISAIATPKPYYVTFKINEDDETEVAKLEYNIENKTIEEPEVPVVEHYNTSWSAYSLDDLKDIVVTLNKTVKDYTVTFVHKKGEEEITVGTDTYNVENSEITAPAVPIEENKILVWQAYTIPENLGNFTVYTEELTIHTIAYNLPLGYSQTNDLKTRYAKLAYHNEKVYIITNSNIVSTEDTLDNITSKLFDNNVTGQEGWLFIDKLNGVEITSQEQFKTNLESLLKYTESQTITITYEENE